MAEYGIPAEVLSDNGKQFTGRFGKPRPAEVLFERICRENGITQRLTKPRSPTTTGKIERLHQTLQRELLNVHAPFATIEDAQAAVDAWRKDYNAAGRTSRWAWPSPPPGSPPPLKIGLRVPAELTRQPPPSLPAPDARTFRSGSCPGRADACSAGRASRGAGPDGPAVGEPVDRRTADLARARPGRAHRPAVGRAEPGPRPAGRPPDQDPAVPAGRPDLARCRRRRPPAGPPPLPPASGDVIEVDRTVNASGNVSLGSRIISAGLPLAGQRVTLRLDGPVAHVLASGVLTRTVACPVPPRRGPGCAAPAPEPPGRPAARTPDRSRRVSVRGAIMVGGQRSRSACPRAGKTAQVTVGADTYQITVEPGITVTAPRTSSRDIRRHKASNYG